MRLSPLLVLLFAVSLNAYAQPGQGVFEEESRLLNVPFEKVVLDNGLTVIVHEDHRTPLVNVRVWYHVGGKNERPGQHSFAHLFEHLLARFSRETLDEVGYTLADATTGYDETSYYQTVPSNALDVVLWMEAERMRSVDVTQTLLDKERSIVFKEARMREEQPDIRLMKIIAEHTYPEGHPYAHFEIGSSELHAATLEEVTAWFETFYGAANAILVVAGDVETNKVIQKVRTFFGDIRPGPSHPEVKQWIARRRETKRLVVTEHVPAPQLIMVWNTPAWGSAEADYLTLAADILANNKAARLKGRLIQEMRLATEVTARYWAREIGGQLTITVTVPETTNLAQVAQVVQEEIEEFAREGPAEPELQRARVQYQMALAREMQYLGRWADGKSHLLAQGEIYLGNPGHYKTMLARTMRAQPGDLEAAVATWLNDGAFVLEVHPPRSYAASATRLGGTTRPVAGLLPDIPFKRPARRSLSNDLGVFVVPRPGAGLVHLRLIVEAGHATDKEAAPGTARLTLAMLQEGTRTRTATQIDEDLSALGAELSTQVRLDGSVLELTVLKENLEPALNIFADVLLEPLFPEEALARQKEKQLIAIRQETKDPFLMAVRLLPRLLYGKAHPYGQSHTGTGTPGAVSGLTRADLVEFYQSWFKPNNATLVVVGDVEPDALQRHLDEALGSWEPGEVPAPWNRHPARAAEPALYLVDRPGTTQSTIFAAQRVPSKTDARYPAFDVAQYVLGAIGTPSRLSQNLREEKGWAYLTYTSLLATRGPQILLTYASVPLGHTAAAIREIASEMQALSHNHPVTAQELNQAQRGQKLKLASALETLASTSNLISNLVFYDLPDSFYNDRSSAFNALTLEAVTEAARHVFQPDQLVWLIVADHQKLEDELRVMGFGPIHVLDDEALLSMKINQP